MAVKKRDTYKYHFDVENTIVETGITYDLTKRESELRQVYAGARSYIMQVGFEPVTHEAAVEWLERMREKGRPVRQGGEGQG